METSETKDGPSPEALNLARDVAGAMIAEAVGELELGREAGGLVRLRLAIGKMVEEWQQAAIVSRREAESARGHAERIRYRVHAELMDAVVAKLKSAVTPIAVPTAPSVDPRQPVLPFVRCTPRPPAVAEDADSSADRDWAARARCGIHGVSLSAVHGCALCNPPLPGGRRG